jgi:uncharacterized protein YndB with AHSA1/START domain
MDSFIATSTIFIEASIEKVWDALTNPVTVKKYFFNTDLVTTWKVGQPIFFRGEWEGKPYEDKGIVEIYLPFAIVSYTYRSSWDTLPDEPENYQLVKYELVQIDNTIKLTISQTTRTKEDEKKSEGNWNSLLIEIKKLLES